jgi:hypothetical protein
VSDLDARYINWLRQRDLDRIAFEADADPRSLAEIRETERLEAAHEQGEHGTEGRLAEVHRPAATADLDYFRTEREAGQEAER